MPPFADVFGNSLHATGESEYNKCLLRVSGGDEFRGKKASGNQSSGSKENKTAGKLSRRRAVRVLGRTS